MPIAPDQTILNKYYILKLLGEGGSGRVWLAQEITFSNRQVAIKEPRTDLPAADLTELQRYYQQELKICMLLEQANAPNLVRTFTVERYEDRLLLVMAYMPGGDLANMLHQQRDLMPIDRAMEIVRYILAPLQVAHNHPQGIVHRDIKPQNILFDAAGKAHLGDWGLAQLSGVSGRSQLSAHPHPGSPLYMAPEQARSTDYLTPAADIYAVGCVLFELLTSKRYKNVRPGTTARSLRNDLPRWLDQVISKALAEDPFDRYEDAAAMAAAFVSTSHRVGQGATPIPVRPITPVLTSAPARSAWGRWMAISSVFVALLISGLLYWRGLKPSQSASDDPIPTATALATAVAQAAISTNLTVTPTATQGAVVVPKATATATSVPSHTATPQPTGTSTPNLSATQTAESDRMATALALTLIAQPTTTPTANAPDAALAAGGSESGEIVWMVRTGPVENKWEQEVVAPAWAKEHPNIKLTILNLNQPDIAVKREAMIAAGEKLDVWSTNWGGDGFASDRSRGLLTDLTPLIEKDNLDTSVFLPEVFKIYQSEGKVWGLPFLTTGSYVFYNMKLFDDAKIPYPTTDWEDKTWTWDAYVDLGKKLTKNFEDPASAQYGIVQNRQNLEGPAMIFGQFPWPKDAYDTGFAQQMILNTPEIVNAYQKHHDLIYKDKVSPDAAAMQTLAQLGGTFQSGRVAMYQTGGWGWWDFSPVTPEAENGFCWGVAPIPWGTPDATTRAVIYTDPWVITRGLQGQELEASWTFVKFLISEDNARSYMNATNTPPTQKKLQEEWFSQFKCMKPEQVKQVYQGAFAHGFESSNHLIVRWDELNQIWNNALNAYFSDPAGDAAKIMPQLETDLTNALQKIANEEKHEFK